MIMISYQQETLYSIVDEVQHLLLMHYQELARNRDRIALAPMWDRYAVLEQVGAFVAYTARHDGVLVGYSAFFINQHMHYSALTVASNDVLFLHPDFRTGRTGIGLIRFCERELVAKLGNFKLTWHAKLSNHLANMLERMGYATEEVVLAKLF